VSAGFAKEGVRRVWDALRRQENADASRRVRDALRFKEGGKMLMRVGMGCTRKAGKC